MIIKPPDDRSKRLRLLEDLRNSDRLDDRQKDWLRNEYRRLAPGLAGELDAVHYIDSAYRDGPNHAVLHDLRLEVDGHVAQIDHLIVNRFLMFFLLETKTYNGSLEINEHGEFSVEYSGERRYGIESPLEQSRRHEPILRKVLEQLGITGRAGTEPTFIHVVMVHPKAIIKRPPADKFDTSMVIKADQFRTWHLNYVDAMSTGTFLAKTINFRGRDTVQEWGEKLKSVHRRTDPLALPTFMKPKSAAIEILASGNEMPCMHAPMACWIVCGTGSLPVQSTKKSNTKVRLVSALQLIFSIYQQRGYLNVKVFDVTCPTMRNFPACIQ